MTIPLGISLVLVLETMARGSAILAYEKSRRDNGDGDDMTCLIQKNDSSSPSHHRSTISSVNNSHSNSHSSDSRSFNTGTPSNTQGAGDSSKLLLVGETKIELADLADMFLGQRGKYFFIVFVR
jgi:hypothetical protein